MNLRNLEYFVETVNTKSFTQAANKLYVSQPALSKAIRGLEIELDVILIDRNAKSFQLTREGEMVYVFATDLLDYYRRQSRMLQDQIHETSSVLRIGITPTSGAMFFFSAIYKFRQQYPMIDLIIEEVTTDKGIEMVLNGELDMSVVIDPFENEKLDKLHVIESEAVLLVPEGHRLSTLSTAHLTDIKDEPILMVGKNYRYLNVVSEKLRSVGIEPRFAFESNQWEFVFEMVANGQGVSVLPKPLVDKFNNSRVKQIHLENPEFKWGLSLVRRKEIIHSSAEKAFWNLCRNEKM